MQQGTINVFVFVTRSADKKFHENLATVLDFALPQPPSINIKDDQQADCGICYATHLPTGELIYSTPCCNHFSYNIICDYKSCAFAPEDDELGTQSGCATDYTCENSSCSRAFHSVCLRDWLRAITTTRQ
jgi:E3 ubiquitin-protein ligase FANCL